MSQNYDSIDDTFTAQMGPVILAHEEGGFLSEKPRQVTDEHYSSGLSSRTVVAVSVMLADLLR